MINLNKRLFSLSTTFKLIIVAIILALHTVLYVLWRHYLSDHFLGSFDEYGIPSNIFHTGWGIMLSEWPLWLVPTLYGVVLFNLIGYTITGYLRSKKDKTRFLNEQKNQKTEEIKAKNQMDFKHALELEELKQQVDILKHKYFEEHHKAEEANRTAEQMSEELEMAKKAAAKIPTPPKAEVKKALPATNAHNEAVIATLKADNKKLVKQIDELQEDLEQSNALIEKLLETQGS